MTLCTSLTLCVPIPGDVALAPPVGRAMSAFSSLEFWFSCGKLWKFGAAWREFAISTALQFLHQTSHSTLPAREMGERRARTGCGGERGKDEPAPAGTHSLHRGPTPPSVKRRKTCTAQRALLLLLSLEGDVRCDVTCLAKLEGIGRP